MAEQFLQKVARRPAAGEVESTVWVSLSANDQYFGTHKDTWPEKPEPEAYAAFVENSNPKYRQDYEAKGWPALSKSLARFDNMRCPVMLDKPPTEGDDGHMTFAIQVKSPPSEAWQIKYREPYTLYTKTDPSLLLVSTPIYPGHFHRSFPAVIAKDEHTALLISIVLMLMLTEDQETRAMIPDRFIHSPYFYFEPVGDNDNGVIGDGDRVYLVMSGSDGKSKGYVGEQKPSPGPGEEWEWKGSLGTERYSDGIDMWGIEFTIHITSPPRPAQAG